ncbi:MAG: (S)-ureidoglycine aminohydrolase [Pirellulales bacterium]
MRTQDQLLGSRTRVKSRYALIPLEGIPDSRLPHWPKSKVRVLSAPALGSAFVEYLIDVPKGEGGKQPADGRVEHFLYLNSGKGTLTIDGKKHPLKAGGYSLIPPTSQYEFAAAADTQILLLRKVYEPAYGIEMFKPLVGHQNDVARTIFCGDPGAILQLLIPDEFQYDIAMNIFTFEVGHSLPVTETHVMEHGLYFLQGKGLYYLDDLWMEVEATDFIWMGPFCPQSFYATGPVASKYLYYKNVNREIPL